MKIVMFFAFLSACSFSYSEEYHLVSDSNSIQISVLQEKDSQQKTVRAESIVDHPIRSVVALLFDTYNYPNWFSRLKSIKTLPGHGGEKINYFVIAGAWPVQDRDAVVKVTASKAKDGTVTLRSVGVADLFPRQSCCVRLTALESTWTVTPIDQNKTKVTYTSISGPDGSLPEWVANLQIEKMPRQTFEGMRRQLEKPEYATIAAQSSELAKSVNTFMSEP